MQLWPGRAQSFPRYMRQGPAPLSCARHGGRGEPRPPDPRSIAKPARLGAGPLEIALDHGHRQLASHVLSRPPGGSPLCYVSVPGATGRKSALAAQRQRPVIDTVADRAGSMRPQLLLTSVCTSQWAPVKAPGEAAPRTAPCRTPHAPRQGGSDGCCSRHRSRRGRSGFECPCHRRRRSS